MKTPKIPKVKSKISKPALLAKPKTKPKAIIRKPLTKAQLEPEPSYAELQFEGQSWGQVFNLELRRADMIN